MEWKDSKGDSSFEDESNGDFLDDDDYPAWQKPKRGSLGDKLFKKWEIPLIGVAAALLVLIILFLVSISGREQADVVNQIASIEKRLRQIEDRLNNLELNTVGGKQIEAQNSKLVEFDAKISRLEASVALRMDQFAAELNRIQKRMPSPSRVRKNTATKPAQTTSNLKYHQVRSGETLYSIGKRYGLKVDELRRLNKMKPGSVIYPGQKLVVKK